MSPRLTFLTLKHLIILDVIKIIIVQITKSKCTSNDVSGVTIT